jgi:hypothetical protein
MMLFMRRGIILQEASPMSGVFQNINPHHLTARRVCIPPPLLVRGGYTRWVERGWGVNILEDARHCSVLYIRKYFVLLSYRLTVVAHLHLGVCTVYFMNHAGHSVCRVLSFFSSRRNWVSPNPSPAG